MSDDGLFTPLSVSPDEMTVACTECGRPIRLVRRRVLPDRGWSVWVVVDDDDVDTPT
jgi:hypothetical protein